MAQFRCLRSGNTVIFTNENDIAGMRKHEGYEEVNVETDMAHLRNLLNDRYFEVSGFYSLAEDSQISVQRCMLSISHKPEIIKSIVDLVHIDVVNYLAGDKFTPEMLFHDPSMLQDRSVWGRGNNSVTIPIDAATSIIRVMASVATKNQSFFEHSHPGGRSVDTDATREALIPITVDVVGGFPGHIKGLVPSGASSPTKDIGGAQNFGRVSSDGNPALSTIDGKHVVTPTSNDVTGTNGGETPLVPTIISKVVSTIEAEPGQQEEERQVPKLRGRPKKVV